MANNEQGKLVAGLAIAGIGLLLFTKSSGATAALTLYDTWLKKLNEATTVASLSGVMVGIEADLKAGKLTNDERDMLKRAYDSRLKGLQPDGYPIGKIDSGVTVNPVNAYPGEQVQVSFAVKNTGDDGQIAIFIRNGFGEISPTEGKWVQLNDGDSDFYSMFFDMPVDVELVTGEAVVGHNIEDVFIEDDVMEFTVGVGVKPGTRVYATVTNDAGQPVSGATVKAYIGFNISEAVFAQTGVDGKCTLDVVGDIGEECHIYALKSGYETPEATVFTLGANNQVTLTIHQIPAKKVSITGTVKDYTSGVGIPVVGANVSIPAQFKSTTTNVSGVYALYDVGYAGDQINVSLNKSGYVPQFYTITLEEGETQTVNLNLPLSPPVDVNIIDLRVYDSSTGASIAGASVKIGTKSGTTDANGKISLSGVGEYMDNVIYQVSAFGYDSISGTIALSSYDMIGLFQPLVPTYIPPPHTVSVSVSPADGGSVLKEPNKTSFNSGETLYLTATPNIGYHFVGWQEGGNIWPPNPISWTVNQNLSIVALFEADYVPPPPPSLVGIDVYVYQRTEMGRYAAPGAEIWLFGTLVGYTNYSGSFRIDRAGFVGDSVIVSVIYQGVWAISQSAVLSSYTVMTFYV